MGVDWDEPLWKRQGRVGPGPFAPKRARKGCGKRAALLLFIALGGLYGVVHATAWAIDKVT